MIKKLIALLIVYCVSTSLLGMKPIAQFSKQAQCLNACKEGDVERVQSLLNDGVDVNELLYYPLVPDNTAKTTFLHWSAKHPELIELLLDRGALLNAADDDGATPLQFAVWFWQPASVELLLSRGADPRLTNLGGDNPLHVVIRWTSTVFFEFEQKAKIEQACVIIPLLKKYNAPLFLQNKALATPFHLIAPSNDYDLVCSLLKPYHSQEEAAALQKASRDRFYTFLLCAKRLGISLPKDMKYYLFLRLPIDCMHAQIKTMFTWISKEALMIQYLKATLSQQDKAMLLLTLETAHAKGKTPMELATDPRVQQLLDPKTWGTL